MKIDLISDFSVDNFKLNASQAGEIANDIISRLEEKVPNSTIELALVSKEEIKRVNKDLRNIDKATDVLSFPQSFHPKAKEKILGSILISPEVAKEEDVSCEDLFAHGLLHLLGYDHDSDAESWKKADIKIKRNTL